MVEYLRGLLHTLAPFLQHAPRMQGYCIQKLSVQEFRAETSDLVRKGQGCASTLPSSCGALKPGTAQRLCTYGVFRSWDSRIVGPYSGWTSGSIEGYSVKGPYYSSRAGAAPILLGAPMRSDVCGVLFVYMYIHVYIYLSFFI